MSRCKVLTNAALGCGTPSLIDLWRWNALSESSQGPFHSYLLTHWAIYLNLGYWETAQTLQEACQALAALIADTVKMVPQDQVLDVGFGFADQDIFWANAYHPRHILGLNITASQVESARWRVSELQMTERIDLRLGSATQMPLDAESVDVVVALECAFHFHTRQHFFQEAFRVLRPGGRLAVADILPMPLAPGFVERLVQQFSWRLVASKFAVPRTNRYDREEYARRLKACGFKSVRVDSIREKVYEPLHRYLARHPAPMEGLHPALRASLRWALKLNAATLYRGFDYILAAAVKP